MIVLIEKNYPFDYPNRADAFEVKEITHYHQVWGLRVIMILDIHEKDSKKLIRKIEERMEIQHGVKLWYNKYSRVQYADSGAS